MSTIYEFYFSFCANRYNLPLNSTGDNVLNKYNCLKLCYCNAMLLATCLREVLLVRDGGLTLPNEQFNDFDVDTMIQLLQC